jgi:hypothetical protein
MEKHQQCEVNEENGRTINITLEEWAENLIERALERHKEACLLWENYSAHQKTENRLDQRITVLELKLKIVHWLIAPFYIGTVAYIIKLVIEHLSS